MNAQGFHYAPALTAADLKRLGFVQDRVWEKRTGPRPNWYGKGHVRVVLGDEGSGYEADPGVHVFAFASGPWGDGDRARKHGMLEWEAHFSPGTPGEVITSMLVKVFP